MFFDVFSSDSPGGAGADEEVQAAEEKFNESKLLAEAAMNNLLENEVGGYQCYLFLCSFSNGQTPTELRRF